VGLKSSDKCPYKRRERDNRPWWHTPVIPALRRLRQDSRVQGQPGLHSEALSRKKTKQKKRQEEKTHREGDTKTEAETGANHS
jgi:hypothetical protein